MALYQVENPVYEYAAKILVGLTFISYLMDIYNVVMHEHHAVSTIFLNSSFATSLFVGLAMGAFALLMGYYRPFFYSPSTGIWFLESFHAFCLCSHTLLYIYDGVSPAF